MLLGVLDIARSVAQSRITILPLLDYWQSYLPDTLAALSGFTERYLGAIIWEKGLLPLLLLPAWLWFLVLSLLLYTISRIVRRFS